MNDKVTSTQIKHACVHMYMYILHANASTFNVGVHSEMLNLTSRLAICIRDIPEWVDWSDKSPQASRSQLTATDILPGIEDAKALHDGALIFLQQFLVREFNDLHHLQPLAPARNLYRSTMKTEVIPMRILFRDEKYVAENVAILGDLVKDANLTGNHQVL